MQQSPQRPDWKPKQRRNPRACDACSIRSLRCQPTDSATCQRCEEFGEDCTFQRPVRRRGAKPKLSRVSRLGLSIPTGSSPSSCILSSTSDNGPSWQSGVPSQALVTDLAEIYFEIVYPVFPLFHRSSLLRRISRAEHMDNRPFCASLMAACALSSARVRDGALNVASRSIKDLQTHSSEELLSAARRILPDDAPLSHEFHYMQATALLAITAIQYGKTELMNYYLNQYHAFVAIGALHDEANWPQELSPVELEERRRLYWSTYTLDVFTSVVWSGTLRSREASSNVAYPAKSDEDLDRSILSSASLQQPSTWLQGWNFVTDLYRILEHAADDLRRLRSPVQRTPAIQALLESSVLGRAAVLEHITSMYNSLPSELKVTQQPTGNVSLDLPSYQAANIAATVQLVRMVYLTNDLSTVEQKCQVASDVIAGFASVPLPYLRAISVPLLHHLAGIGQILGATFDGSLRESSYRQIQDVLLKMADLIATLELNLYAPAGASDKLRLQVSRLDEYMSTRRLSITEQREAQQNFPNSTILSADNASIDAMAQPNTQLSPEFQFPAELFVDWSWTFDTD